MMQTWENGKNLNFMPNFVPPKKSYLYLFGIVSSQAIIL